MVESMGLVLVVAVLVASGIAALPWSDGDLRASVKAWSTLVSVPGWLGIELRRRMEAEPRSPTTWAW